MKRATLIRQCAVVVSLIVFPLFFLPPETQAGSPGIRLTKLSPFGQDCPDAVTHAVQDQYLQAEVRIDKGWEPSLFEPIRITYLYHDYRGRPHAVTDTLYRSLSSRVTNILLPPVPDDRNSYQLSLTALATHRGERTAAPTRILSVHRPLEVRYDGNVQVARTEKPVLITGCLPGGPSGSKPTFSESRSESRARSYTISGNAGVTLEVINLGFGFSVTDTVTSGKDQSIGYFGSVPANQFGVVYRQTMEVLRLADVLEYSGCGQAQTVGQVQVMDYLFAYDFAYTTDGMCPPFPEPNFGRRSVMPQRTVIDKDEPSQQLMKKGVALRDQGLHAEGDERDRLFEEAMLAFAGAEAAASSDEERETARMNIGWSQWMAGDDASALRSFSEMAALLESAGRDQDAAEVNVWIGSLLLDAQAPDSAAGRFWQAYRLAPDGRIRREAAAGLSLTSGDPSLRI